MNPRIDAEFLEQYAELEEPGLPSLLEELVSRFMISAPERLNLLENAARENDLEVLRQEAHALKNIVSNIGAIALANLCQNLEVSAEEKELGGIATLVQDMKDEFLEVVHELEKRGHPTSRK